MTLRCHAPNPARVPGLTTRSRKRPEIAMRPLATSPSDACPGEQLTLPLSEAGGDLRRPLHDRRGGDLALVDAQLDVGRRGELLESTHDHLIGPAADGCGGLLPDELAGRAHSDDVVVVDVGVG